MNSGKLSLNRRLSLISIAIFVPMTFLVIYLLYILYSSNNEFNKVTESVTYANKYAMEFKQRMDYSMYLAVIRGEKVEELDVNEDTVNGIQIVNPYDYIEEIQNACDEMTKIATVNSNKTLPLRIKKTLNSLKKRVQEIDEKMEETENYESNMEMLDLHIYSLTTIIEGGIQDYVNAENTNFSIIKDEMKRRSEQAVVVCIITTIIVVILSISLTMVALKSVIDPIKKLCEMSKQVAKGDFTARTKVESKDEIAVLTNNFNEMTAEIGHLVKNIKTEQENLRFMEMKLLQAQINPHFLYNTLDAIIWLAEAKQTEKVVSMVTFLSDFFRTMLSNGQDYIDFDEEKRHVESYLKIQQVRYQDILEFEIQISSELYQYKIPKLTLQPLVENALYHGIKNKRGKGKITILGYMEEKRMVLEVIDNGKGMSEEELARVRGYIAVDDRESSFGMNNVNNRLKYYYGPESGIFLESRENEGTRVIISIPIKNLTLIEKNYTK